MPKAYGLGGGPVSSGLEPRARRVNRACAQPKLWRGGVRQICYTGLGTSRASSASSHSRKRLILGTPRRAIGETSQ